jgi:hypothetical protein
LAFTELTTAEQFVLGTCRCWDAFMGDADPAALALLAPDEERLLCVLACLQRAAALTAIRVLAGALTDYGVRCVLPPLARIAAILDLQGHRLPAWGRLEGFVTRKPRPAESDEIFSPPRCPAQ